MDWKILYVNSRAEKKVTERLTAKGFEAYCPMRTTIRQWTDRKKKIQEPYFPSYVFVRYDAADQLAVLQTKGVVMLVNYTHRPAVISESGMQTLIRFFEDHTDSEIIFTSYEYGQRPLFETGEIQEEEGILFQKSEDKEILYIEELGMAMTVEKLT